MTRNILARLGLLCVAGLALAACGGGGSSSTTTTPAPPAATVRLEDQFGTQFGTDFRNSPNTQPVKPAQSDVIASSLTTPPVALH